MRPFTAMNSSQRDKKVSQPPSKKNRTCESSQRLHSKKRKGSTAEYDDNSSPDELDIDNDTVANEPEIECITSDQVMLAQYKQAIQKKNSRLCGG